MRTIRVGLALGLLVAAAACGGDDDATSTTEPPPTTETTTEPTTTSEPPAPSTAPATTAATTTPDPTSTTTTTITTTTTTTTTTNTTAPPAVTTTPPATTAPGAVVDVKVYFLRGERLAIAHRQVRGPATLRGALNELLAGPTADERAAGLFSEIPTGTVLLDLNLADETATVDLSDDYGDGGGTMSMQARIAQVVFTATQFDNSDRTQFWIEGGPIDFLGGEGIVLDEPFARMDAERSITGGVIFDMPPPNSTVRNPFTVTGEGDVFEGDFPIVIRRNGVQIAGPFLGFAGAWGAWADFDVMITLDAAPGPIDVVALDEQGCTPGDPDCGAVGETVLELDFAG